MSTAERPKILVLITHLERGGAQETVVGLAGGMRRRGFDVTVGSQLGGPMQGRLEADDVPLVHLPHLVRQVSPADDARAYREMSRLIRDGGFDVVHTHSSKAGVIGRTAARRAKVPVIDAYESRPAGEPGHVGHRARDTARRGATRRPCERPDRGGEPRDRG